MQHLDSWRAVGLALAVALVAWAALTLLVGPDPAAPVVPRPSSRGIAPSALGTSVPAPPAPAGSASSSPDPIPAGARNEPARAPAAEEDAGSLTFPEFSSDDESFDPAAFRAVAERWLRVDEAALRARLEEFAGSQWSWREEIDLEKLALLLAFLFQDGSRAMPVYMVVDDADWIVASIRATFPAWPILERGGVPFSLPSLVFDVGKPLRRGGGSFGVSGREFPAWALAATRRAQLPPLCMDPLRAADELAQQVRSLVAAAGGSLPDLRIRSLRDQAFRCLGERARRAAAAELGLELDWNGAWFRQERTWLELRGWLAEQRLAWDAHGRYELVER